MRTMPTMMTVINQHGQNAMVPVPIAADWSGSVEALVARKLTAEELAKAERMAKHNWSVRVAAEAILGRDLTYEEVESRRNW